MKGIDGVEDIYAYRRGSVGFARFKNVDAMFLFLKMFNEKNRSRPIHNGKTLWAAASRSPADTWKGKTFSTYKRVLVEVGLADANDIDFDAKRGVMWAGRVRIGEWDGEALSGRLVLNRERMVQAGMNVEPEMIDNAVKEALGAQ